MLLLDILLHMDKNLQSWTEVYGGWIYGIVFLIVFCETGLVVLPFLPGDSLLFALGSMTTLTNSSLSILNLSVLLLVAAFLGDNLNYFLGRKVGQEVVQKGWVKEKYLKRTQEFCTKYGKRAVVMARFVPIVRTFVPFVSGLGKMNYREFMGYSLLSTVMWTQIFLWAGAYFGNLPIVKRNFEVVILIVIAISLVPGVIGYMRARRKSATEASAAKT